MYFLPPELLYKVLTETDIDVLLPLLKNDNVPDVIKERFEVVTSHNKDLKFWSKDFKRSHLETMQPVKGKQYLIEISSHTIRSPFSVEFRELLELNGFVYLYEVDCSFNFEATLTQLIESEGLLIVGSKSSGENSGDCTLRGEVNFDRLRYISLRWRCLRLYDVIPKGELSQKTRRLTILSAKQKVIDSISPTLFESLERLDMSTSGLYGSDTASHFLKIKDIEFSSLKRCKLSFIPQMENLRFPNLARLEIHLSENGDPVYLKDIEAPKLRTFEITTDCDFEVKNVVINKDLEKISLENRSKEVVEIKGLNDCYVTAHTLKVLGMATAFRSKSFIRRFQKVSIIVSQLDFEVLDSLEEEYPSIKELHFSCFPNTDCPMIRAPNLGLLQISLGAGASLRSLSHSHNITELDITMKNRSLPHRFDDLKKLKELKSLRLVACYLDVKEMEFDSPAWNLPKLESFDLQFASDYTNTDNLTVDIWAPRLKSLSVQSYNPDIYSKKTIDSLTLKNLPNLKDLIIKDFRYLTVSHSPALKSIKCVKHSRYIQSMDISSILRNPFKYESLGYVRNLKSIRIPKIKTKEMN